MDPAGSTCDQPASARGVQADAQPDADVLATAPVRRVLPAGPQSAGSSSRPSANRHHGSPLPAIDSPLTASSNILPNIASEFGSTELVKRQVKAKDRGRGR